MFNGCKKDLLSADDVILFCFCYCWRFSCSVLSPYFITLPGKSMSTREIRFLQNTQKRILIRRRSLNSFVYACYYNNKSTIYPCPELQDMGKEKSANYKKSLRAGRNGVREFENIMSLMNGKTFVNTKLYVSSSYSSSSKDRSSMVQKPGQKSAGVSKFIGVLPFDSRHKQKFQRRDSNGNRKAILHCRWFESVGTFWRQNNEVKHWESCEILSESWNVMWMHTYTHTPTYTCVLRRIKRLDVRRISWKFYTSVWFCFFLLCAALFKQTLKNNFHLILCVSFALAFILVCFHFKIENALSIFLSQWPLL